MMQFDYDPRFVEQAAFLAARSDPNKECALHELLDPLYRIRDLELRHQAFRAAYGDMFTRLGLDRIVPGHVRQFVHINRRLTRCLIREAERSRAQSVDLYDEKKFSTESGPNQILIIALRPELLLDSARLAPWIARQLQHVEDMLDERFAYDRTLPAVSRPQQNLIRERYAVLWDVYVEGRLIRTGKIEGDGVANLWSSFCKTFSMTPGVSRILFEKLLQASDLKHAQLLDWAAQPDLLGNSEGDEDEKKVDQACMVS